jgi:hypothetical protein
MDIIRKIIWVILLVLVMNKGVLAIALTAIFTGCISVVMVCWVSNQLFDYKLKEHLQDNLPNLAATLLMGFFVYLIQYIGLSDILTLIIQIPVGVLFYLFLAKLFRLDGFQFSIQYLKKIIRGKKHV